MARVQTFQSVPDVQGTGTTNARYQAQDYGQAQIGEAAAKFGGAVSEAAQKADEIGDIQARTEANRLMVEHTKLTSALGETVREAQGENAAPAVQAATTKLEQGTSDIMSRASPRARELLADELPVRNAVQHDNWHSYAFEQGKTAFIANTDAANNTDLDAAVAEPDEAKGAVYLGAIKARTEKAAQFLGWGADQLKQKKLELSSAYFSKRALNAAAAGDPISALAYADAHKNDMTPGDYADIQRAYHGEAIKQRGFLIASGQPDPGGVELQTTKPQADPTPDADYKPVPKGWKGNQEDAIRELGMTADQAKTFIETGKDPRPAPTTAAPVTADPHAVWTSVVHPNEGSSRVKDSNGHWVQYGLNGKYHPEVDNGPITEAHAEQVFTQQWHDSGADKLPPALAALHMDTYFLSQAKAASILKQVQRDGGGFDEYMRLRKEWMASITPGMRAKSGVDYTSSYDQRNANVSKFAALSGTSGSGFSFSGKIGPYTDMDSVRSEVMARTDIPLDLKMSIIDAAGQISSQQREAISVRQSAAHESAIDQAVNMDDKFTSISQLDPNIVTNLSAGDYQALTNLAKNNTETGVKRNLDPYVTNIMVSDPKTFVSPGFINTLASMGATPDYIAGIRQRQAEVRGQILQSQQGKVADPLSTGELWTIAGPVAQHVGLNFETDKNGKPLKGKDKQAMEDSKFRFTSYLRDRSQEWAVTNPGKKPPEEEIRKWVAAAALTVGTQHLFDAPDTNVYMATPAPIRQQIIREWTQRNGHAPSPKDAIQIVADVRRRNLAFRGFHDVAGQ